MAIANYTDLKTAMSNWSARSGTSVTDRHDEFIVLAEDRLFHGDESIGLQPLRIRAMEANDDLTISSQETSLPTGFLEARRFYLNTSAKEPMPYYPPERFWESVAGAQASTGMPVIYTIEGNNLVVAPSPDTSYTGKLLSFKKLDGLTDTNATNWLITNSPATYLAAVMLELAVFTKDRDETMYYQRQLAGRVNGLNTQDKRSRYGGSILNIKTDRSAPYLDKYRYRTYS